MKKRREKRQHRRRSSGSGIALRAIPNSATTCFTSTWGGRVPARATATPTAEHRALCTVSTSATGFCAETYWSGAASTTPTPTAIFCLRAPRYARCPTQHRRALRRKSWSGGVLCAASSSERVRSLISSGSDFTMRSRSPRGRQVGSLDWPTAEGWR